MARPKKNTESKKAEANIEATAKELVGMADEVEAQPDASPVAEAPTRTSNITRIDH